MLTVLAGPQITAESRILIVQKNKDVDAYALVRSAEVLSEVLKEAVYSQAFINRVVASPFGINDDLGADPKKRMERWKDKVRVRRISLTGIVSFSVRDKNALQALKLNSAILATIDDAFKKLHGKAENIVLVPFEPPYLMRSYPGLGILTNSIIGLIGGLLIALFMKPPNYKMRRRLSDLRSRGVGAFGFYSTRDLKFSKAENLAGLIV